jgi:hypothetical protein
LTEIPIAVERPAMEWAGDPLAAHLTADSEMSSQVRTVGIKDPGHAVLATEEDEVASEIGQSADLARSKLVAGAHAEPTVGCTGEGVSGAHGPTLR